MREIVRSSRRDLILSSPASKLQDHLLMRDVGIVASRKLGASGEWAIFVDDQGGRCQ